MTAGWSSRLGFPAGAGPTMALKTCLFTNSPDEHFILTVHPEQNHAKVAALRWLRERRPIARTRTFLIYDLRGEH